MTDRVTESYIRECLAAGSPLRHATTAATYLPVFHASCGTRMLSRPFFIDEAEIRGFAGDVTGLFDLLVSLPQRLFDGDIDRYCAALGIDARQARLMRRFGGGRPSLYGRADLYHDGSSFKLLEFNVGSELGGTDRAEINRALLEVDAFRRFATEHRLDYVHTGQRIARMLRTAAVPVTGGADPVVALVEGNGGLAPYLHLVRSFQEMMRTLGVEVVIGEIGQIRRRSGRLYLHGRPIDVVLRYFSADQIVDDPDGEREAEVVFRAHEDGEVVLWTTMESSLFANKGCLALLSEWRWRGAFSVAEAALLDRVLPWTRTLGADAPAGLLEHCMDNREQLILKPRADFAGAGIVVGWETSEQEWKDALASCRERGYVVQERVCPRPEPVVDPQTGLVEDWLATWDVFLTPEGYAGSHIRALPAGDSAVIGMGANPRARTTGVFNYPSEP